VQALLKPEYKQCLLGTVVLELPGNRTRLLLNVILPNLQRARTYRLLQLCVRMCPLRGLGRLLGGSHVRELVCADFLFCADAVGVGLARPAVPSLLLRETYLHGGP
jgi:hypothetical protein